MRAVFVACVLFGAFAAGCIGGDTPPTASTPPTPTPSPPTPEPPIVCEACNVTPPIRNGTGAMDHKHDYWGGKESLVIYQQDHGLVPLPLFPCKRPGCDIKGGGETYAPGTAIADFDIPAPPCDRPCGLVYEGTDHLEVLIKDVRIVATGGKDVVTGTVDVPAVAHPHININVDYLTAADEPFAFRTGGKATPGTAVVIPVKPTEVDMPHQSKSLWVFRIYTDEANQFEFNITITAVRGNAVVDWPPHPNIYAVNAQRVIFDGEQRISSNGPTYLVDGNDAGWQYPSKVISWGSDSVEVEVTDFVFTSPAPVAPAKFLLEYHNASHIPKLGNGDQAGGRAVDKTSDGRTYRFSIPVDAQGYDTPYGDKSRWGFRFVPRFDDASCPEDDTTQSILTGCQWFPWTVTYHIRIVAHGHDIEPAGHDGGEDVQR